MAKLNFPTGDPPSPTTYTKAGITWTWNSTLKVWSTDDNAGFTQIDADGRYLRIDSSAGAQEVASTNKTTFKGDVDLEKNLAVTGNQSVGGTLGVTGASTFTALTTHEGGAKITGGTVDLTKASGEIAYGEDPMSPGVNTLQIKGANTGLYLNFYDGGMQSKGTITRAGVAVAGLYANATFTAANTSCKGFTENSDVSNISGKKTYAGFHAMPRNITFAAGDTEKFYGFLCNINADTDSGNNLAYAYYATGSAPSYFKGGIQFDLTHSQGGTQDQLQLDFYEEGEWTPVIKSNSSISSIAYDTTYTGGYYSRVGNNVFVTGRIKISSVTTTGSNALFIQGLPFIPFKPSGTAALAKCTLSFGTYSGWTDFVPISGMTSNTGGSDFSIAGTNLKNGLREAAPASALNDGTVLQFSGHYLV